MDKHLLGTFEAPLAFQKPVNNRFKCKKNMFSFSLFDCLSVLSCLFWCASTSFPTQNSNKELAYHGQTTWLKESYPQEMLLSH